ncbi:outer membrane protein, multidrug efflux system [Enhydrobacter aerosaccus]|uniref:Outer membrane protein, multidrug efflux system n=1 Tax=Enhydrobacter aerosaccus TaxID=225324 RepID=A0A1T4TJR6_9HYPH|nr:efflux transporter outer membrane subunit [Enhydrobacter aerosaccus]SKA40644.1 outer membrane protein, multidrug efflux system [Enhydrobacter aerosaccus]
MTRRALLLPITAALLAGCSLAPDYARPPLAAPSTWPQGAAYEPQHKGDAGSPWLQLIADPKLRTLIQRALSDNRGLRAAIADVASARARYRVTRSAERPTLSGTASGSIIGKETGTSENYTANAGLSGFEIDLFGRLRSQSEAAFETYLATDSGARSARITLVAETATAYVTLASSNDLLRIAQETVASSASSVELTRSLLAVGLTNAGAEQDAITVLARAQSDVERYTTQVAQDRNTLELLVGSPVEEALLPAALAELDSSIAVAPAGLSSQVLLQHPDVVQAEHRLKGANANIGAARAAFFPAITLTSAAGVASTALSSLFTGGAFTWSVAPSATVSIFGGPNIGNLAYANAQRDFFLAGYEKTVQTAFKDVADALARRGTIARQRTAQSHLVEAANRSYQLADAQYRAGAGSFLNSLISQRTLYSARQTQINVILTDLNNRIALYRALGADNSL